MFLSRARFSYRGPDFPIEGPIFLSRALFSYSLSKPCPEAMVQSFFDGLDWAFGVIFALELPGAQISLIGKYGP